MKELIREYLEANLGIDDEETTQMLLDSYMETMTDGIAKIDEILAAGDFSELARAVHALKGCSANIGAKPLHECCLALEAAAKGHDLAAAREHFSSLRTLKADLEQEL